MEEFLSGLDRYLPVPDYPQEFAARVFKITRDDQGSRLTWMKITGGSLKAKTPLSGGEGEDRWEEKADQLRLYSGAKFRSLDRAEAGSVVAVTGLTHTRPGQGLGAQGEGERPALEPALTYELVLPPGADPHAVLPKLRQLEEEDPMLRFVWDSRWKQIQVRLMGQVQLEILKRVIAQRFDLEVDFGPGRVLYRETIASTVEGVGHFEPLRHYAEVHLLLEPGPRGSGVQLATACSTDQLDLNWQRLVFTHLLERDHPGVLTGSPLTDVKITLLTGRAHEKHTEGGDFRQATYRAVRQGLMQAQSILLEPFYDFTLEVPAECVGRAMTDIQTMGGTVEPPQSQGDMTLLTGFAPVAGMRDYWQTVTAYTRGCGRLSCALRGYEPCHNAEEIVKEADLVDADLIIMGIRGHSAVSSFLFGSVSNAVLAHTHRPILMLRDKLPEGTSLLRIGIACDGSEYGERAVDFVLKNRALFGSETRYELLNAGRSTHTIGLSSMASMMSSPTAAADMVKLRGQHFDG